MACEMFLIGSLAGLALTAGALIFQFLNNKKREVIEKEQETRLTTTTTTSVIT
jgi:hypothetical protein